MSRALLMFRNATSGRFGRGKLSISAKIHTGSAIEYFTWLNAKLNSIEAMPSSRVSLFFRNAS